MQRESGVSRVAKRKRTSAPLQAGSLAASENADTSAFTADIETEVWRKAPTGWCPSKAEGDALHKKLEPGVDLRKFDEHVLLAVWLYLGIGSKFHADLDDWKRIAKILRKTDRDLCKVLRRLQPEELPESKSSVTAALLNVL